MSRELTSYWTQGTIICKVRGEQVAWHILAALSRTCDGLETAQLVVRLACASGKHFGTTLIAAQHRPEFTFNLSMLFGFLVPEKCLETVRCSRFVTRMNKYLREDKPIGTGPHLLSLKSLFDEQQLFSWWLRLRRRC